MIGGKVNGLDNLATRLRGAGTKLAARALEAGLEAGGEVLRAEVAARTPRRTGKLASSLVMAVSINPEKKAGSARIGFGDEGHIARFVEFGHRQVSHSPKKKESGEIRPQPFMRPAFDAGAPGAVEAFANALEGSLAVLGDANSGAETEE